MYQYILRMYWYKHFRRVSSRVSGFQMLNFNGSSTEFARLSHGRAQGSLCPGPGFTGEPGPSFRVPGPGQPESEPAGVRVTVTGTGTVADHLRAPGCQ